MVQTGKDLILVQLQPANMAKPELYMYVVDRDFGFAPNPFHGYCTLATCKPGIRSTAQVNDWVIGVGGGRLKSTGKCVFAMKVTKKTDYNNYWSNPEFRDKRPVRNGSKKMLIGDNIYHFDDDQKSWLQAHSHHSMADGTTNQANLERDTTSNKVLISRHFYYFGNTAPVIPSDLLDEIGYENKVGHRKFPLNTAQKLIDWIEKEYGEQRNLMLGDPFNFDKSEAHYSVANNKVTV